MTARSARQNGAVAPSADANVAMNGEGDPLNGRKAYGTYSLNGEKIRRPPNAFMIFAKERRREILYSNRELTNKDVSKILGEKWHALPDEVRAQYKRLSDEMRAEHQSKYPGE